jgi:hypothetical protein
MTTEGMISCTVAYYYPQADGTVLEKEHVEQTSFVVRDGWVYLGNSAASAPAERLLADARADEGFVWVAQFGTKPVHLAPCPSGPRPCSAECGCGPGDDRGGWGGRNYPEVRVSRAAVIEALR